MPYFRFTCKLNNEDSFIEDMLKCKSQVEDGSHSSKSSISSYKEEESCLETLALKYANLPDHLKHCFDYCCMFISSSKEKGKLVRLLLAEGLIPEKPGDIMEDTAANIIAELIGLGMLREVLDRSGDELGVNRFYYQLSLIKVEKQDFVANAANTPLHVVIRDDGTGIDPNMKSLLIRSLFVLTAERCGSSSFGSTRGLSQASMETICAFQFLLVLDLDGEIKYLPNQIGDLVHLRYLGLVNSELDELPQTLGNLQKLQTLDIRMCGKLQELPVEVLNIQQLRHLLMSRSTFINHTGVKVPMGIGALVNLHTCTGVYAGCGIATELSALTQLSVLGVNGVSEDHARELSAAIMKMENLISLSLEAELYYHEDENLTFFPEFESFSPPPLLQELHLDGGLFEIPIWLASMSNLTKLDLCSSNLPAETPISDFQFLPKLKHLTLWMAYKAKQIGEEFCQAGGYPELQTLTIASSFLVEWTEIEIGAFPKLRSLCLRCWNLRFLPEGLQNISTLEDLTLSPLHEELAYQLIGEENYKIKHISKLHAHPRFQRFPLCIYVGSPQDVLLRVYSSQNAQAAVLEN